MSKKLSEIFIGGLDANINGGNPTQSRKIPTKKGRKPVVYEDEFKEDAGAPTNSMGQSASNPNTGNIQGFSPLLKQKKYLRQITGVNKHRDKMKNLLMHSRQQRQGQM